MAVNRELESIRKIYRDPMFDRALRELRDLGGLSAAAAKKAEAFIASLTGSSMSTDRESFRFTRNGEYRIKNFRKVDLAGGYRIICIQKDGRLVLLYMGTHDDCFRWIERRRTSEYDLNAIEEESWLDVKHVPEDRSSVNNCATDDDVMSSQYEESLLNGINDSTLRKIFSGLVDKIR
jgi:hypothetical protein